MVLIAANKVYGDGMTLILFNKPYDVLSQFTDRGSPTKRKTLSDYIDEPNVYPAGRLDKDSEGLLLLTDDGREQSRISDPKYKMLKTYFAQVEGEPSEAALSLLRQGVKLKDGVTRPADVKRIEPPDIWARNPPIRVRKTVADSWIEMSISEGKNRQVRRMCAAVGFPVLRLIRWRIGDWSLDDIKQGQWKYC